MVDGLAARRTQAKMSASESEAGTLNGSRSTAFSAGCDAISSAIRTPRACSRGPPPSVRKLRSTGGFESGIGVRRPTLPRDVGLIITGPNA